MLKLLLILAVFLALYACAAPSGSRSGPLFRFAVIADVQYAAKETVGLRDYRRALTQLRSCVQDLSGQDLAFVVQLGDVIDGRKQELDSREDLELVLGLIESMDHELVHVVGNHCLAVPRTKLMARLGLERAWYEMSREGWRFVVLDSMQLSVQGVPADDPRRVQAQEWLDTHDRADHPQAFRWNGGFGAAQLAWLETTLADAREAGERVVIFSHHPVSPDAAEPSHLAWDYGDLLAILGRAPNVVAYLCGHYHRGGRSENAGVMHWTLPAMLEAPAGSNAYAVIEVWPDRLVVDGVGQIADETIEL